MKAFADAIQDDTKAAQTIANYFLHDTNSCLKQQNHSETRANLIARLAIVIGHDTNALRLSNIICHTISTLYVTNTMILATENILI